MGPDHSGINPVDRWTAIGAASILIGINQLVVNIQPLLLGSLAIHEGLTDTELGLVSSALVGGASLASATGPMWVRRVNWRAATLAFLLAALVAVAVTSNVTSFAWLCVAFGVLGFLKGGLGVPAFVSLSDTKNPEGNFGTSVAVQALIAAAAAAPVAAYLIPRFGTAGVYYCLGAGILIGLAVVSFLPVKGTVRQTDEATGPIVAGPWLAPFTLVMVGLMCFTVGITGFWFYLERIGTAKGVAAEVIGLAVSGTALITIPGSISVTWLSKWLNGLQFAVLGSLIVVGGYALVGIPGPVSFMSGSLIFAFGWGVAQPGFWALAREYDHSARLFVLAPAVAGVAAVLTGFVAGPVIEAAGYDGLILLCSLLLLLGSGLAALAKPLSRSFTPTSPSLEGELPNSH